MKIGGFAAKNKISIDTVRHYTDMNLIIPDKQGGQYIYDERCQKDFEDIANLKGMGFTLNEIKNIFVFKRLGILSAYQEDSLYQDIFHSKLSKTTQQLKELTLVKTRLEEKILSLSSKSDQEVFNSGIDIKYLNLFRCLKCSKELLLSDGHISNNQIINGRLGCKCGEEYFINDGILVVNKDTDNKEELDYSQISEYINSTDEKYLSNLYIGLEWEYKKLDFKKLNNKILLEFGSGVGFFLRYIYNDLPDDSMYIAVDHDISSHRLLKSLLKMAGSRKNVIFICSDFLEIPISEKTADVIIDITGTSNYSFEHKEFMLKLVDKYVKDNADILGSYILFKKFSPESIVKSEFRKNFNLNNVKKEVESLRFKILQERLTDNVEKGGKYENYFKSDETVHFYAIYGKRQG